MYIFRFTVLRTLEMLPVLVGVTLVAFAMLRVLPGDPATLMLGANSTPEAVERLRQQLGLDEPIWAQYVAFVYDLMTGSFGDSLAHRRPATAVIGERLGPTLWLIGYSTVIAVVLTFPLAVLSAVKRGRFIDQAIKSFFVAAMSMPQFWLGVLLMLLFAIKWPIFPVSGYGEGFIGHLWHLFLPSFVIALGTAALTIRSLRNSILAVQTADYIDTAYAKGLTPGMVMRRHILRNSLISTVSVFSVHTSWIIGGTVVVEAVFAVPGLGELLISSIFARDYPVVQGLTITFAGLVLVLSLLTDIAYVAIDPRVKIE